MLIEVKPRPKMGESLRNMGYTTMLAIADIVDNCIDANADIVRIYASSGKTQRDPVSQIDIFDNGCGMIGSEIEEALTLGAISNKGFTALGCFGMGLKTAGTSLGRCITVISRALNGTLECRVYDLDTNEREGMFVVELRQPTESESDRFDKEVGDDSGTWISLSKIDKKDYKNVKTMLAALKGEKNLRLIFRKFLAAETCSISVNGSDLQSFGYDYVKGVGVLAAAFPFTLKNGTQLGSIKLISTMGTKFSGGSGGGRPQGLVVVRNNRDITPKPEWRGTITHDWELNGVYAIWEVEAQQFDSLMGTTVMKNDWSLPQYVSDAITREISPDINAYKLNRRKARKEANAGVDTSTVDDITKSYSNNLNNNMNMTPKPKVHNEEHIPVAERNEGKSNKTKETGKTRKPFTYANGNDEWAITVIPGCGDGRYFVVRPERKQRGGRRFHLSIDTNHPWVGKHFLSDFARHSSSIYATLDHIIGDAYMEMEQPCADEADQLIRSKSNFLRGRANVTTVHDSEPTEVAAK